MGTCRTNQIVGYMTGTLKWTGVYCYFINWNIKGGFKDSKMEKSLMRQSPNNSTSNQAL